jgi:methionine sulfoxide reductase heme-binding subunit
MDGPRHNLAWLAKHHFGKVRVASFVLCLCPALWLAGEWLTGTLGINPLNRLLHFTGRWALILLTITLTVTPARRLSVWISQGLHARYGKRVSDWNWLIRLRRQLGLYTFFYAGLHLATYIAFDAGPDVAAIRDDAAERPFILLGMSAFALLVPLAATSNQAAMRALGRGWRRLHMATYAIAVLAIVHFWIQVKVGDIRPLPYSLTLAVLLAWRVQAWRRGDTSAGVEVKER